MDGYVNAVYSCLWHGIIVSSNKDEQHNHGTFAASLRLPHFLSLIPFTNTSILALFSLLLSAVVVVVLLVAGLLSVA